MKKIFCIGGITTDIIIKSVDRLPSPGSLQSVDSITAHVGGCAANCAIDLAKLGIPAMLCARTGIDNYGAFIRSTAQAVGVDTTALVQKASSVTTVSVVCGHSTGERSFIYSPGSSADFSLEDIDMKLAEACDIVFVAGAMLLSHFDGSPCATFLDQCRKMGKFTAMDTAWDYDDIWLPKIRDSLDQLDLFMPSYDEAVKLSCKDTPEEIAAFFASMGVKNIVIKLGSSGAFLQTEDGNRSYFPSYAIKEPVDTTGAGDSFCAGLLAGLAQNWSFHESMRFANAVGAHCIMEVGASSGIKPINDILKYMKSNPLPS